MASKTNLIGLQASLAYRPGTRFPTSQGGFDSHGTLLTDSGASRPRAVTHKMDGTAKRNEIVVTDSNSVLSSLECGAAVAR